MEQFKKKNTIRVYVLRGIFLGLLFPIISILICLYISDENTSNLTLHSLHEEFPLLWVINTAPFVLGAVSYRVGSNVFRGASIYSAKINSANSKLKEQNKELNILNKEKEVLLQEIHHRVKNNLQIIISLMNLQMNEIESEETRQHFKDAVNRILVISKIHGKLYQEDLLARVNLASYLRELTDDLVEVSGNNNKVQISINSDIEFMELKTIMPLGLIINELLTNSLKYAFIHSTSGHISINLIASADSKFILNYSDDGVWLENGKSDKNFGLELVKILHEQMDGSMEREISASGTKYSFLLENIEST